MVNIDAICWGNKLKIKVLLMDVVVTFKSFKENYSHHLDSLSKRFHEFALAKYPKTIAVATKNICINGKTSQKAPSHQGVAWVS